MTRAQLIAALLRLPGVTDVDVFTLKSGVARVCVTGGDKALIVECLRDGVVVGVRTVLEYLAVRGGACTEMFL